jgi:hypothetical protein
MEALKQQREQAEQQPDQVEETTNSSYTSNIEFEDLEENKE